MDSLPPSPALRWKPTDSTVEDAWQAYNNVQRKFKNSVVENHHDGDLIWIHGFHFLLLPMFVSRSCPSAKIGLFLHTPFPSSEIFRTLTKREDLLRGMLHADQVPFTADTHSG
jgi:trehalose 6-phosphate synthase/phosphatase